MLESFDGFELKYEKLTPEEMQERGILGRLVGPMCDTKKKTRNGRLYNKALWDKALNDPMFKEQLENKVVLAEVDHPADRSDIDTMRACAALAEMPKLGSDGLIYGVWDILDTAPGKVINTLCKYGSKIGISSRGEGDIEEDFESGDEIVIPDTYDLKTWDLVLMPSVKEARMNYVTEALDVKRYNKTLRQRLNEELDKANADDKIMMKKTLDNMGIKLEESKGFIKEYKGYRIVETPEVFVITDAHGKTVGESKTIPGCEGIIDDLAKDEQLKEATSFDGLIYAEKLGRVMKDNGKSDEDIAGVFRLSGMSENEIKRTLAMLNMKDESCNEELADYKKIDAKDADYFDTQISKILNDLLTLAMEANDAGLNTASEVLQKAMDAIEDKGNELTEECNNESCADKKVEECETESCKEEVKEAVDNSSMIKAIQEAISAKKELEEKVMSLQSEKAVSDAKVEQITEELNRYKNLSAQLSTVSKEAKSEAKKLSEELNSTKKELKNKKLKEAYRIQYNKKRLDEELSIKDAEIKKLNESLRDAKADLNIKIDSFNKKLEKQIKLTEAYKKAANNVMSNYIESKAVMLGVKTSEIRARLSESYTIDDVNKVCEELQAYKLSVNSLPFKVGNKVNIKFTESKKDNLRIENSADDIDDDLLQMAGLL